MNEGYKLPKLKAVIILALCLSLIASGLIGATIAKYISSITGSSNADVAVWSIEVNDQQVASSEAQTFTFDLFDTLYEEDCVTPELHVSPGVIAPGTGGAFTIKVENLSQVDAEFTLTLTEDNEDNIPIQYSIDLSTWYDDLSSLGHLFTDFFLERETGITSKMVYWRWCYTGSDTAHLGQTDDTDTALGLLALTEDVTLTITADLTVGQYFPRPEAPAAPVAASITENSVTLVAIDGCEYAISSGVSAYSRSLELEWQDSPTFTGLTAGTEYTFYARYKATAISDASESSSATISTTSSVYHDFIITTENVGKITYGNIDDNYELSIPDTFYDEEDETWYTVVGIADGNASTSEGVFSSYDYLTSVIFPETMTNIGSYAFYGCNELTMLTFFSNDIESIGDDAFEYTGDGYLSTYITGGNDVVLDYYWEEENRIPEFAAGHENGTEVIITADNRALVGYFENESYDNLFIRHTIYEYMDGVWSIVVGIDNYAFANCGNLENVHIAEGIQSIGSYAFGNCTSLTTVTIPSSVTSIGDSAFANCTGLQSVYIPDSVAYLGYGVFSQCDSLTDIYYAGSEEEWAALIDGDDTDSYDGRTVHYNYTSE